MGTEILHPAMAFVLEKMMTVKIPAEVEEKYFSGLKAKDRAIL